MASRLVYFTPKGPLCFIDYLTVSDGRAVLEQIKKAFTGPRLPKLYEFRLFEKLKNGLVRVDDFVLPKFDLKTITIFLDSLDCRTHQFA
ncbi:hypothetical protein ACFOTA_07585 [Chitinophaga sp. GCM10012297]|uniref:Uncharacterized protein n=1 Tax=Chitinophaga chungangae TaxID=2821488 RepID=A0ABS3YCN7_9BACT|nr:hypothetical protein [Chitinophaga chungangae]MBO9152063.1 hypothetical protein [Chitinophaga chungangae]